MSRNEQQATSSVRRPRFRVAALLALAAACVLPWPVAAADPSPSADPAASVEATAPAEPTPVPQPSPTGEPDPPADPPAPTDPPPPPPTPAPTPTPSPTPAPTRVTVKLNLYKPNTVARQYTSYWCVPANAMTMLNTITGSTNRSYARQRHYDRLLKRYNRYRYATRGNDVQGWARLLDAKLPGPLHYDDRSFTTKAKAMDRIVEALDRTRHPVGITVGHGTHAWTVLGYRASMIPGRPETRVILGFYVSGSLANRDPYPYGYLTVGEFRRRFGRYHEWQRKVIWEGKYVIISE